MQAGPKLTSLLCVVSPILRWNLNHPSASSPGSRGCWHHQRYTRGLRAGKRSQTPLSGPASSSWASLWPPNPGASSQPAWHREPRAHPGVARSGAGGGGYTGRRAGDASGVDEARAREIEGRVRQQFLARIGLLEKQRAQGTLQGAPQGEGVPQGPISTATGSGAAAAAVASGGRAGVEGAGSGTAKGQEVRRQLAGVECQVAGIE